MPSDPTLIPGASFPSADLNPPARPCPALGPDIPFEIGIAMAGAVAAGAYHGGFMDYLIEALDAWHEEKHRGAPVPPHRVTVKALSGASGGAMTAAIAATVLGRQIQPVRSDPGASCDNPFFQAWVNDISIWKLLGGDDLKKNGTLVSLLDSTELEAIAARVIGGAANLDPYTPRREWLDPRLPVHLTVGNLRGVPYWSTIRGTANQGYGIRLHRDHVRFTLAQGSDVQVYDDETRLDPAAMSDPAWTFLTTCGLGSGAFPLALAPRQVNPGRAAYRYRTVIREQLAGESFVAIEPSWNVLEKTPQGYAFPTVDGGTMNNEPLDLVRHVLAGRFGRNPRDGDKAGRATILVDPFPELSDGPRTDASKLGPLAALGGMVNAMKMQSRSNIEDLALASAEEVYSRYLVSPDRGDAAVPSRGDPDKKFHLAGNFLGGFGGFLSRGVSVHDYMLGRLNAHNFLKEEFALPNAHPLFAHWSDEDKERYAIENDAKEPTWLPIIPLVKSGERDLLNEPPPMPAWPNFNDRSAGEVFVSGFDLIDRLKAGVGARFKLVWPKLTEDIKPKHAFLGKLFDLYTLPARWAIQGTIDKKIDEIDEVMQDMGFN